MSIMDKLPGKGFAAHKFYKQKYLDELGSSDDAPTHDGYPGKYLLKLAGISYKPEPTSVGSANLISSEAVTTGGKVQYHRPLLDIDVPAYLVPSSTPGHSHLYIDHPVSEQVYGELLEALAKAGVVQRGIIDKQWKPFKATFLRLPWVKKGDNKMPEGEAKALIKAEIEKLPIADVKPMTPSGEVSIPDITKAVNALSNSMQEVTKAMALMAKSIAELQKDKGTAVDPWDGEVLDPEPF